MEEPVLILGTGAMACLFGARLSAAGIPVQMYGRWKTGIEALRNNGGVRLVQNQGIDVTYPVQVFDAQDTLPETRRAIILVKSFQTPHIAEVLGRCLHRDGIALTLQNGLGNWEALVGWLGERRVMLGVTTVGSTLLEPGRVIQSGDWLVSLGDHPHASEMLGLFRMAGFIANPEDNPLAMLWSKLVINASINPITALLRVPNGELLKRSAARHLLHAAAEEAAAVALASGIRLSYDDPLEAVDEVASHTAQNLSSMLQDVLRGGFTEIDSICGEVVRRGTRLGVETPILNTFWLLIKSLEPK